MRIKTILLLSVAVASTAIVGLTFATPALDDFWLRNPFWNGLSEVYSGTDLVRLRDLTGLVSAADEPSNATILMLGPSQPFSAEDVGAVDAFLRSGGRLVLADEFGTGNSLLEGLGVDVRFSGLLLVDPLFKEKNSLMPRALNVSASSYTEEVEGLTFNYPTALSHTEGVSVLVWSNDFSYLTTDPDNRSEGVVAGPFPVAAEVEVGDGRLILISDSSLFINSMLDRGDNRALLMRLAGGEVFLDESHSVPSRLARVKLVLIQTYSFLRLTEIRYGLAILAVVAVFKVNWGVREAEKRVDEVEGVLRRHPEWDRELLVELDEARRRSREAG